MFKFLKGALFFAPFFYSFLSLPKLSPLIFFVSVIIHIQKILRDRSSYVRLMLTWMFMLMPTLVFFNLEKTMPGIQSVLPMKPLLWRRLPKRVILPKELPPLLIDLMENYLFVMMGTLKDMAIVSFQICITVA